MNSKKRVLTAFNHKETDRVPLNYLGTPEVNQALMGYFSIADELQPQVLMRRLLFDFVGVDSEGYDKLLDNLHVDIRTVKPDYSGPEGTRYEDQDMVEDIYGCIHKKVKYSTYISYELVSSPLAQVKSIREVNGYQWPRADWFDYSKIAGRCARKSDYALAAGKTDFMGVGAFLQGMEQFLVGLEMEEPVTLSILDHLTEFFLDFNRRVFESAKGQLDIAWYGDDYGTQNGLLISTRTWRKLIRPRLLKLIELAKSHGLKVMFHSCGSVRSLIPDFIDIGIDILDGVQPEAVGMEPGELKRLFGRRICFHGTISTGGVLACGSSEDVRKEVIGRIQMMAPGGGFCLAPAHTVMPGTPVQNVISMYDAAILGYPV
jgi:uroporphyrinogen decarboxylase